MRPYRRLVADVTYLDAGRLHADAALETDVAFAMDEDAFRAFYDRTAGPLWGYLSRISGDRQIADDLLQDAYYRLLKCGVAFENETHRRNRRRRRADLAAAAGAARRPPRARPFEAPRERPLVA